MSTQVAYEHTLPFDPLIPNETTIAAMRAAREGKLHRAHTIEDLRKSLYADD